MQPSLPSYPSASGLYSPDRLAHLISIPGFPQQLINAAYFPKRPAHSHFHDPQCQAGIPTVHRGSLCSASFLELCQESQKHTAYKRKCLFYLHDSFWGIFYPKYDIMACTKSFVNMCATWLNILLSLRVGVCLHPLLLWCYITDGMMLSQSFAQGMIALSGKVPKSCRKSRRVDNAACSSIFCLHRTEVHSGTSRF